ncbi:MAG TPA: phosphoglycolate phosphatase [Thermoplasmata archaeon]|nr:phosphoglycolate phosphatase [Thermoplasmata archaeon]
MSGSPRRRIPPKIRAIVTDVDGTLTDADRVLNAEAVRLIQSIQRAEIPVIIATGNVLPIALALHRSIGLTAPIVAENGGLIYTREHGRDRVERCADRAVAYRAFRAVRAAGLPARRLFTDRWRETEVALEQNMSVRSIESVVDRTQVRVEATGYAIHLMQRGCGKLPSIRRVLARIGLTPSDCLIAGDGDNDAPMLRAAGWGVSFPNASARARAAAHYVSRSSYAKGFSEGLIRSGVVGRSANG